METLGIVGITVRKKENEILLFIGLLMCCGSIVHGHGRVESSIKADIGAGAGEIRIQSTVEELLEMEAIPIGEFLGMGGEERESWVKEAQKSLAKGFTLFSGSWEKLEPKESILEDVELESGINEFRGIEQKLVGLSLKYTFEKPPERLIFWQSNVTGSSDYPFYSSFTLRREGQMVMLPAEIGPGFPISYTFNWDEAPVNIATVSNLREVSCGPANRFTNGYLEIEKNRVSWRLSMPILAVREMMEGSGIEWADAEEEKLKGLISETMKLEIEGAPEVESRLRIAPYPYRALGVLHGDTEPLGSERTEFVEITLEARFEQEPSAVNAQWTFFGEELSTLIIELVETNTFREFKKLSSKNDQIIWDPKT